MSKLTNEQQADFERTMIIFFDWAMVWHRQAGGYAASDTALVILKASQYIKEMIDNHPDLECFRPRSTEGNMSEPTLEEQIQFLKQCYSIAARGLMGVDGTEQRQRAEKSTRHLEATIKLLESMTKQDAT